jgi:flagellar motor switch protein FliM
LDVELAILYAILDRMLGGRGDAPPPRRAPSDIELPLAARIVRVFLTSLREAWQNILPLQFETLQVGSHPRLIRVLPADETVAVVGFALTIGNRQGMMRLCLPCRALRQIADKLSGGRTEPSAATESEEGASERDGAGKTGAEVTVTLATTSITRSELRSLRVGDIILTETPADAPAIVSIDGVARFHAKPGASAGRKAAAISDPEAKADGATGEDRATA